MTEESWKCLVIQAVLDVGKGDSKSLDLLVKHLAEVDTAIQVLRDKEYGWTGLGILETVETEVPNNSYFKCAGCGWLVNTQEM